MVDLGRKIPILYTKTGIVYRPIYVPNPNKPMHVIVFASGGGGNLKAAIDLSRKNPLLLKIGLVVTDRLGIKAIDIARHHKIQIIAADFEKECGVWAECKNNPLKTQKYRLAAIQFHNHILNQIIDIEKKRDCPFDLVVLSYHRWIHGNLLDYFTERIINQHAGDLTVMCEDNSLLRSYIGINPVLKTLQAGEIQTRTSTFVVREGQDNGEILCQGPWVKYLGHQIVTKKSAWQHEIVQKKESDWPSLRFALEGIARGYFGLAVKKYHEDGCKIVLYKGEPLSYGGIDITKLYKT